MQRKDELLLDWAHARTHDEAIDAIIALGKHLQRRDTTTSATCPATASTSPTSGGRYPSTRSPPTGTTCRRWSMSDIMFPEAPVSWNVRSASSQGCDCQLNLRGVDAAEVLKLADQLMAKMGEPGAPNGHEPRTARGAGTLLGVGWGKESWRIDFDLVIATMTRRS